MQPRRPPTKPNESATRGYDSGQLARLLDSESPKRAAWNTETVAIATIPTLAAPPPTPAPAPRAVPKLDFTTVARGPVRSPMRRWAAARWSSAILASAGLTALAVTTLITSQPKLISQIALGTRPRTQSTLPAAAPAHSKSLPRANASAGAAPEPPSTDESVTTPPTNAASTTVAVAALVSGRERDALAAYRALARAQPERPVFAAIAAMLEHRLGARCKHQLDSGASACAASAE